MATTLVCPSGVTRAICFSRCASQALRPVSTSTPHRRDHTLEGAVVPDKAHQGRQHEADQAHEEKLPDPCQDALPRVISPFGCHRIRGPFTAIVAKPPGTSAFSALPAPSPVPADSPASSSHTETQDREIRGRGRMTIAPHNWDSRLPLASPDLRQANRQGAGSGTRHGWAPSVVRPSHRLPKYCATGTDESRMLMLSATHVLPDPEYLRFTSSPILRFASDRGSIPWRITV